MKKALIVTTVSGFVPQFEMGNVKLLRSLGYEIHYASNYNNPSYGYDNKRLDGTGIVRHQVDFVRSPFCIKKNLKALHQLIQIVKQDFQLIHCHTPMGGVLTRLAVRKLKATDIKVIYTAHGFHFYKGAPLINWLCYYPVEKWLARYTDGLITINNEDYNTAQSFRLKPNGKIYKINGIGIDSKLFQGITPKCTISRKELGIAENSFLLISVGELINRKNHRIVIEALSGFKGDNIQYLICGKGAEEDGLKALVRKLKLEEQVIFAGYRSDIKYILPIGDCFIFPSKQEGLPVALMEAMASGLPIICSKIRGNSELLDEPEGGFFVTSNKKEDYYNAIKKMVQVETNETRKKMGYHNMEKIKYYVKERVEEDMKKIYINIDGSGKAGA